MWMGAIYIYITHLYMYIYTYTLIVKKIIDLLVTCGDTWQLHVGALSVSQGVVT